VLRLKHSFTLHYPVPFIQKTPALCMALMGDLPAPRRRPQKYWPVKPLQSRRLRLIAIRIPRFA